MDSDIKKELEEFKDVIKSGFGFILSGNVEAYWNTYFNEGIDEESLREVVAYLEDLDLIKESSNAR